jgi:hypothetical protein
MNHTDMLRTILAHGMSPDVMNWQRQMLLHHSRRQPELKRWIASGTAANVDDRIRVPGLRVED